MRTGAVRLLARVDGWRVPLRRSRLPRAIGLGLLGLFAGLTIDAATDAAARREEAWGDTAEVWVLRRALPGGATIERADVERVVVPSRLRPHDATVDPPDGRRLRHPMTAAEVVREGRLADGVGTSGAGLGPERVGLPVEGSTPFVRGDLVALHDRLQGSRLTDVPGEVITADDTGMVVAVAVGDVAAVIRAQSTGGVLAVLVG